MELLKTLLVLIDKGLFLIFFMSCLFVFRQIFLFIRHLMNPEPKAYEISHKNLYYTAVSLSIILTGIIKGIGL